MKSQEVFSQLVKKFNATIHDRLLAELHEKSYQEFTAVFDNLNGIKLKDINVEYAHFEESILNMILESVSSMDPPPDRAVIVGNKEVYATWTFPIPLIGLSEEAIQKIENNILKFLESNPDTKGSLEGGLLADSYDVPKNNAEHAKLKGFYKWLDLRA